MVCMFVIIYQNVKFCKTFFQLILVWEHGSARLTEEKTPEVLWNRKWTPICGHFFWDNQYGPNLFCKKLDSKFIYGKFTKRLDKLIERDSIWIGNCGSGDDWLSCTGGCNNLEIGGECPGVGSCSVGGASSIEIECQSYSKFVINCCHVISNFDCRFEGAAILEAGHS